MVRNITNREGKKEVQHTRETLAWRSWCSTLNEREAVDSYLHQNIEVKIVVAYYQERE